ncbi:hypothetical protein GPJ56_006304 [Histomonas meleagridis]|uniref:uncharacterized protein n=1 Tax=Histomonas meleagridis TaxID=135588 RepID=UPI003559BCD4|nr:hypothetical protein GPJ56_006304 [Histomonas meleagridis]KAH0796879.1 hypothetical protein GO595_010772 [Histomonas meleagridis]
MKSSTLDDELLPEQHVHVVGKDGTKHITVGIFHVRNGPTIFQSTIPQIDQAYANILFPSRWDKGVIFATKKGDYFILGICVIASHIKHERGPLQVTISIFSLTPIFSQTHLAFLEESVKIVEATKSLEFQDFINLSHRLNIPTGFDSSDPIPQPLQVFTHKGTVCKLLPNPQSLLSLWRARMLALRVFISATDDISEASDLSYFIGSIAMPFTSQDDCVFHVEIGNEEILTSENWGVASVTHPILQDLDVGDVTFGRDKVVHAHSEYKFLLKGKGSILSKISDLIKRGNDSELLQFFFDTSAIVKEKLQQKKYLSFEYFADIGFDTGNTEFILRLIENNGGEVELDVPAKKCC